MYIALEANEVVPNYVSIKPKEFDQSEVSSMFYTKSNSGLSVFHSVVILKYLMTLQ